MVKPPRRRRNRKSHRRGEAGPFAAPTLKSADRTVFSSRRRIFIRALIVAVVVLLVVAGGGWLGRSRMVPTEPPPNPDLSGVDAPIADKIQRLQEAVSEHPRSAADWGRLALTLHAHSFLTEAVLAYTQAAALDRDDFRWTYLCGMALRHQQSDEALQWFERSYALRADYTPLLLNYGGSLLDAGQLQEATLMFQRALIRDPASPHALLGLGKIAVLQDDLTAAQRYFERALNMAPLDREIHTLLAEVYARQGDKEAADRALARSKQPGGLTQFPDPVYLETGREGVGSFWHLRRGEDHMVWGQFEAAAAEFERAVELSPDAASHTRLGVALERLGRLDEAVYHLETAAALAPTDVEALRNLSAVLFTAGRIDEAIARAEEARQLNPTFSEIYLLLSQLHARSGEWRDAVAILRQGYSAVPDDARILAALAWLLATAPEPTVWNGSEAVRLATVACDLTSHRVVEPLDALAAAYAETGQYEQAIAAAQQALELALEARHTDLANEISERLDSYRAGRPWRVR